MCGLICSFVGIVGWYQHLVALYSSHEAVVVVEWHFVAYTQAHIGRDEVRNIVIIGHLTTKVAEVET